MTTPTIPTEGDLGFSYEFQIDIDMDFAQTTPTGTPDWYQLSFITAVDDKNDKNMADSATYKNRGAAAQAITGESWELTFTHQVQRLSSGLFIPTLAALIEASKFGKRNKKAQGQFRWYDTEGADLAFQGVGYVARARAQTGNNDIAGFTFTITGDGAATAITNPYTQPLPTKPQITSVTPSGAAATEQVAIRGARFTGTVVSTGVKFGGTNATAFQVIDDTLIIATLPTGSAGSAPVIVTNVAGASDAFPYTRA